MLSGAFHAHEFLRDSALSVLESRLLASARPAVLADLHALAGEEKERTRVDRVLRGTRDRAGILHIYEKGSLVSNYDQRGANIGAAGDNASATNFTQGSVTTPILIGNQTLDQFQLVSELAGLRASIAEVSPAEPELEAAQLALIDAEASARDGDGEGAQRNLARCGKWVLRAAEATGVAVAAAAIRLFRVPVGVSGAPVGVW